MYTFFLYIWFASFPVLVQVEMELAGDLYPVEIVKPRALQILDQAYDPSTFKFSQIIRYLQDQYSYHQELTFDSYNTSTSPLPVDPKLAYDIHTGRYMRRFKTQGSTIVAHSPHGMVKLPYPSRLANPLSLSDPNVGHRLPKTQSNTKNTSAPTAEAAHTNSDFKSSHNLLRRQVWKLPTHVTAFSKGKYKQPLKLPPITVSKLMNGI